MLPSFSPKRQVVRELSSLRRPLSQDYPIIHHVWVPWQHRVHIFLPLPVFPALASL